MRIGFITSGHLIGCTVIRRSTYDRKAGSEIHTILESQSLERSQTLVMVHCKGRVKLGIMAESEEAIRRIGTEGQDPLLIGRLDGRKDDLLLLIAKEASVTTVRIESEDSDLGFDDSEIPLEGR